MEKFGRVALKTLLWIVGSVIFLVVLILVLIQVPAVQNFAKNKVVVFLQNKIHTKVQINKLSVEFPKLVVLEGVYFADQKGDTLLAGDKLKVDISMFKLLHHRVEINEIDLQNITSNIKRTKQGVFNFDYITKAFAGDQKKEPQPTDTTSSMKFSVDKIALDKINILYKDDQSGNDVKFILGHFDTRIKDFDMDKMKFTIPKITLSGFNARIIQTPSGTLESTKPDTAVKQIPLDLKLGVIDLSKIHVDYTGKEMKTNVTLGKLLVDVNQLDFKNQSVKINSIQLDDTKTILSLTKPQTVQKVVAKAIRKLDTMVAAPQTGKPWILALNKVSFIHNDVKFDNEAVKPAGKGLDYMHMDIHNLNMDAGNFTYDAKDIKGTINSFNFSEKSGLNVKKFHTVFMYGEKQSYLNDLYLETPQTVIQNGVQVSYPSIASLSNDMGAVHINANVVNSRIGLKDILLIMPTMASMEPFKSSPNAVFKINSRVIGKLNNLSIPNLDVTGLGSTHIKASGIVRGLPDMNKAYFDIKINDFNTSKADIVKLVPAGTIPANISLPATLNVRGTFKGGMKAFSTNLNLRSSDGAVDVIASVDMRKGMKAMSYTADIKANNLNVGKLAGQQQNVGLVTMNAKVKGSGIDPKTANITFSGDIVKANIKGYTYQNLVMSGTARGGAIDAKARMKDPNINFALDARANMSKKYPSIDATLNLDSVDLQKLNFSKTPMRFHGKLVAHLPTADPDYLNGSIDLTDILVVNGTQRIQMDSINVIATANSDSSTLRLKSQMIKARLAGKYKLTEIGTALQAEINKYFAIGKPATVKYSPERFTFTASVTKTPLLKQFMPDLKQLEPITLNGSFDSEQGKLVVNGNMPKVVYGTNIISNTKLAINTNNNALNYSVTTDEIKASQIDLLNTSISGSAQNNKLGITLLVRDINKKERYRMAGTFTALNDAYQFSFLPTGLLLNYMPWAVSANNSLQFGGAGILARDFTISNAGQSLSINTSPPEANGPLNIDFKNFKIETLTQLAQQKGLLVGGTINGNAQVKNLDKTAEFTSNINITDFNFKGDTLGNVAIKVNNQQPGALAANVAITGKGNQVNLDGFYYTDKSSFDMNLNIVNLNLKSIEGFTFGNMRQASGAVTGQLKVTGTASAPVIRGDITFNKAAFNIAKINSYYKATNEKITFNDDGIMFNHFTLIDSAGNKAVVTGTVYTKNYSDFKFGLDVNTKNFRVFNAIPAENKLYYGQIYLDSQIQIRGDMNEPIVDATLKINDKTRLTIVLPQTDPSVEDRQGVVEFVNKKSPRVDSLMKGQLDSLRKSSFKGMDVSANIVIDKNAEFIIIVDERNGDVIHLKGDAQLNGGIDPSGKTNLTGTYTVNQGSYDLSYATFNRRFLLKPGSTVTWQGDPTSATLNITAIYVAKVAPIDLVSNQLSGETEQTMYKEKLPFNVDLHLTDQLMKPTIGFDIVLPDSTYNVSSEVVNTVNSKLDQLRLDPNEMNKQVFAVLLLNHFIGQNPFQSQGGGDGFNGALRNSVSSLLSDQLNNLAGNLIQGVDVNFALQSGTDYSSGTATNRTDLNVGLSKRFLNDRLTVSVGNNFNLEGQQAGEQANNIAGDVSVGYKLTQDGRYQIRAYRKDQFIVVQGQVVETGVGFSLTVDYNRFSQIFSGKTKKEKEMLKKQKEEDKANKDKDKALKDKQTTSKTPATTTAN
ncbi:translocation/assembly module TamB domain-containing protein [Mucilaginibacter sp. AW1-3]